MKGLIAVSLNTFRESVRQKIFLIIVIFGIVLILISFFLFPLSVGEQSKILRDFGLSGIFNLNIIIIIISGGTIIHKEIERRTIYLTISSPIKRKYIIIGKFFGLFLISLLSTIGMTVFLQILIFLQEGKFDPSIFIAIYPFIFEIGIMIGILVLFSSFSSSIFSSFAGFSFYIIGHLIESLKEFAEISKLKFLKFLSYFLYYILPNLENFNIRAKIVYKELPEMAYFIFSTCYGIIYIVFLLFLSQIIFEKREFK